MRQVFFSSFFSQAKVVVTLIRNKFLFQQDRVIEDNESLVAGFVASESMVSIHSYELNFDNPQDFYNLFLNLNDPFYELLIGGDLNLIIDILHGSASSFLLQIQVKMLKQELFHHKLIVVWRFHNKHKDEYTLYSEKHR